MRLLFTSLPILASVGFTTCFETHSYLACEGAVASVRPLPQILLKLIAQADAHVGLLLCADGHTITFGIERY